MNSILQLPRGGGQGSFPPVDLYNTEGALVALVNLPGADIDQVEVTTNNDTLTVSGEMRIEQSEGEILWQERTGGKIYRSFKLPVPIKADQVDANFKAGFFIFLARGDYRAQQVIFLRYGKRSFRTVVWL